MPCVSILLFTLIGILLAHYNSNSYLQSHPINLCVCVIMVLLNASLVKNKGSLFNLSIILLLITLGFTRYNLLPTQAYPIDQSGVKKKFQQLEARVLKKELKANSTQLTLELIKRAKDHPSRPQPGQKVLLYKKNTEDCSVEVGDLIKGKTILNPPRNTTNPDAFNYRSYLHYQGIDLVGSYKCDQFKVLAHLDPGSLTGLIITIRAYCLEVLQERLLKKRHFDLCSALVIGQKSNLTKEMKASFSDSGAMHVLAVSGLHVGILVQILLFICGQFKAQNRYWILIQNIIILLVIWIFVLVTGASPSVLRSASMFSLFVIGRQFYQPTNAFNIIAGSALILLLLNPHILFQASFQFSYIALTSIVYFYPLISPIVKPKNRLLKYFWQISALSLAAQILIIPLSLYYFHKAPWYSVISSLVAVPAAGLIIGLSLLLFVSNPFSVLLASKIALVLSSICELLIKTVTWIQSLPLAKDFFIAFDFKQLLMSYLVILSLVALGLFKNQLKQIKIVLLISSLAFIGSFILRNKAATQQSKLVIYDTYKGIIIDVFMGKKCYEISSPINNVSEIEYATGNHRIQNYIKEVISLEPASQLKQEMIAAQEGYWQVKENLIVFLNEDTPLPFQTKLNPALLILEGCSAAKLTEALLSFIPDQVIISANVNKYQRTKIIDILQENNVSSPHDIRESGSYKMNL